MRNRPLLTRIFPPTAAHPSLPNPSPASGDLRDPVPVIALHGTLDSPGAWAPLADGLRARGRRVYVPAYGDRGTAALVDSVAEVESYINGVCTETNSDTVDIVAGYWLSCCLRVLQTMNASVFRFDVSSVCRALSAV